MAPLLSTPADTAAQERRLLDRLLGLYETQERLYGEVLELSRHQNGLVREGAPLARVRTIVEQKKARLETIGRLEMTEQGSKNAWREGRHGWSAAGRTRLHDALDAVGRLIEDILACEEENDRELLRQSR
jgi:hypothetical protein